MEWTAEVAARFSELRQKDLAGSLNTDEKNELAELFSIIEADEEKYLAGALAQMRDEQAAIQMKTEIIQQENMELVRIINQQQQLIDDARRWIAEFERRHLLIQRSYAELANKVAS